MKVQKLLVVSMVVLFVLITAQNVCGQEIPKPDSVKYYNHIWFEIEKEKATYCREIFGNLKRNGKVRVVDYYYNPETKEKSLQATGWISSFRPEIKEGVCVFYNQNGNLRAVAGPYINGKIQKGGFIAEFASWNYDNILDNLEILGIGENRIVDGEKVGNCHIMIFYKQDGEFNYLHKDWRNWTGTMFGNKR